MEKNASCTALIVAAGQGKRFGGAVSKQFINVRGRPLLWYTLRAFEACPEIGAVIVILPPDAVAERGAEIAGWGFAKYLLALAGGAERHDSVANGLAALPAESPLVAIHDGVRPLITPEIISACIAAAQEEGAAIAAVPPKDTIKEAEAGRITATLDRRRLVLVQTPQVFRSELIRKAYEEAFLRRAFSTDDAALVEALGHPVRVVAGDYRNIKVTSPEDLLFVNACLGL
ncbi:MAG TPA: 2-C-methyl-D-erythritol 4-phosphate cytidylyltransferase [bacterium]|nr:2-C-methyl-D-erythritol 4-phosphate cytidylyltransferase [bacterium]HPR88488.1 2-C-methyl-D-erythritol 4-phosphate cytidylyltransferase [bacterium]